MNNETILKLAIKKAVESGGFKYEHRWGTNPITVSDIYGNHHKIPLYELLFSHQFAKAFFGTDDKMYRTPDSGGKTYIPVWQYHLMKMVISENPIAYLEQFLEKERGD